MMSIRVDDRSGEIFSGSLRGLLRAIASQEDSEDYHTTLLMTHDYYVPAHQLLESLILFYRAPIITIAVQDIPDHQRRSVYQSRLIDVVGLWMTLRFDTLQRNPSWSAHSLILH